MRKFVPPHDNPKYVIFSLMTGFDRESGQILAYKTVPDATVYDLGENNKIPLKNAENYIIDKLREHVKKYGTIDELKIFGHGSSQSMMSYDRNNNVDTKKLLQ